MNFLIHKLTEIITSPFDYDDEQRAVIQYGLFAILQIVLIGLVITLIGLLADCVLECWIVYVAAGLLRKSTGGAHAKTANACFVVSIFAVTIIGLISRYFDILPLSLPVGITFGVLTFSMGSVLVYRFAPIGHPNKPLDKSDKVKRLRRQSFVTLVVYAVIAVSLSVAAVLDELGISLFISLSLAVLWQSLTLVKTVLYHNGGSDSSQTSFGKEKDS